MLSNGIKNDFSPSRIQLTHGAHMGVVVAILHKPCQGQLENLWRVAVHNASCIGKGTDQLLRQGHVSHSEPGVECLTESAEIDGSVILVQALDACGWQAIVVKLTIVVVLDNPAAVFSSPASQIEPAFQRQSGTGRVLV